MNFTDVAPVKVVPVMTTGTPTSPLVGLKPVIPGLTENVPELVPVPAAAVTVIFPVVAAVGTVAVIFVDEFTVKDAAKPLNFTEVIAAKFEPLIVTEVPTGPLPGENPVTRGATVNVPELVALPAALVTLIFPVVALVGTLAVIWPSESTLKVPEEVPLNLTALVPVKFEPLIVTLIPTGPLVGEKPLMTGGKFTVKSVALVAVPAPVVTVNFPAVAPEGTVAVILLAELTL